VDYWSFEEGREFDFFKFREPSTSHLLEVQVMASGGDRLPFNLWEAISSTERIPLEVFTSSSNSTIR
jgi:hypothetical protein